MRILLLPFILISDIIRTNPIKIIFLTIGIVLFSINGRWGTYKEDTVIVKSSFVEDGVTHYVYKDHTTYRVTKLEEKVKLDGEYLKITKYTESYFLLSVISGIILLVLLLITIMTMGDSDGWCLEYSWIRMFKSLIYCEIEDDKYYYMILGRLIQKSDRQINIGNLEISSFREVLSLPKFKTKRGNRESLLNSIGIK